MKVEKLRCAVQTYDWGKTGRESVVASLRVASGDFIIDETKPYAELWMGVHANGPSIVSSNGVLLSEFLSSNSSWLAPHERNTIQFLFKILSVKKALSVQAHPTKDQAVVLHTNDPLHYPDGNHKPELAIAITDFQLLCGFRRHEEILKHIKDYTELEGLIKQKSAIKELGNPVEEKRKEALKCIFSSVMRSPENELSSAISLLIARLKSKSLRTDVEDLIIRLDREFPGGDVGVLAPLLLNYFTLKRGESVYLGPNQPHAYLSGDCVECMACSDNTIRAGLTPKFKDVATLCSYLTFEMSSPPYFHPNKICAGVMNYAPPVSEFAVHHIKHDAKTLPSVGASRIMIVLEGSTKITCDGESISAERGEVLFFSADTGSISVTPSGDFGAYVAFTPQIDRTAKDF